MPELKMGANAPIAETGTSLLLRWPSSAGALDCSAFLLGATGRVAGDDDMVFYNQTHSKGGAIRLEHSEDGAATFFFDLKALPGDVERIVVCAVVDGGGRTMAAYDGLVATLGRGSGALRFTPELAGASEVALRLVEIYRRAGAWKLRADGQGFEGGLRPLAESFGVEIAAEDNAPAQGSLTTPSTSTETEGPTRLPEGAPVADRVEFEEVSAPEPAHRADGLLREAARAERVHRGDRRVLTPTGSSEDRTRATLAWSSRIGGADGRARPLRPVLAVFFQLAEGGRGVVGAGTDPAPAGLLLTQADEHAADCRGEASASMRLGGWPELIRLDVWAYLEGAPSWRSSTTELLIEVPGCRPILMSVPPAADGSGAVLIARILANKDGIDIECLLEPAVDAREIDDRHGWRMDWRRNFPEAGGG